MRDTGPVELMLMYYELLDPCFDIMVKWQHRGVTYRDPGSRSGEPHLHLTPYERASVNMLAGITRLLERQSERPGNSHEEDVVERFRKQGPKEFAGTTDPLVAEEWIRSMETM
ncbi:hypothetical protein F511_11725 [Dorcoceras hygrometricum]|uniref:Uncharacterized protein n=1 Tax=Dorcoceras hygrometricum TaxID=472368 RepID=A0A2Z7A5Q8_9LAMI|nr:hypothetical protein F511_11725 [Dorcoceras hygrometricum]